MPFGGTAELRTGVDETTLETADGLDVEDFFAAMVVLLYRQNNWMRLPAAPPGVQPFGAAIAGRSIGQPPKLSPVYWTLSPDQVRIGDLFLVNQSRTTFSCPSALSTRSKMCSIRPPGAMIK